MTREEKAQIRDDVFDVYFHVARDARGDYLITHPKMTNLRVLLMSIPRFHLGERTELENIEALEKLVGWVLHVTELHEQWGDITPEERRIGDAAARVASAFGFFTVH